MYARMTVAHVQPEHFDEAVAAVQEGFFPAAQAQPGYSGFLVLTNQTMNQLVGISLWESETDMERSRGASGYFQQRMDDFAGFVTEPPTITTHEVAVREPGHGSRVIRRDIVDAVSGPVTSGRYPGALRLVGVCLTGSTAA